MARYSCAEWAPIAWMNALRHTRKTQLTFHITAGEGDPRTIATWRNGTAGSNFVVFRDGRIVQIADSACKSAADYGATHTISVEFVGKDGPLTDAQVAAAIRLAREAHERDGIPLRLAATSSDAGIGWHRLGVDGNFPHGRLAGRLQRSPLGVKTSGARGKACPTDSVIDQIHDVILPALTTSRPATPAPPPVPVAPPPDNMEEILMGYPFIIRDTDQSGWTLVLSPTKKVDIPKLSSVERAAVVAAFGEPRTVGKALGASIRAEIG